ncbi:site-2 protease family protein [Thermodesulfobacteriota bacterium]
MKERVEYRGEPREPIGPPALNGPPAGSAPSSNRVNLVLFAATVVTTLLAGAAHKGVNPFETPGLIYKGIPFSFTLLAILLVHEMGHYIQSRRYGCDASLPFFIPFPSIIGTMGAFIKMRSRPRDRGVLVDVGATGPIAGFVVAVPAVVIGLMLSEVTEIPQGEGLVLGDSILFFLAGRLVWGVIPEGFDILLHPVAFAGWIGLLVTSLNLIPVGQLDGGHILYTVFRKSHDKFAVFVVAALIFLGLYGALAYQCYLYLVWGLLVTIIGYRHPPPLFPEIPLSRRHLVMAGSSLVILILTFVPVPFYLG